ncbi:MAG: hypothetical protein V5788_11870 [Shewanella sp.]
MPISKTVSSFSDRCPTYVPILAPLLFVYSLPVQATDTKVKALNMLTLIGVIGGYSVLTFWGYQTL